MNLAERSAKRPMLVTIAVTIFSFNAILMLIWWLVLPDEIVSNGSQVFFVLLWLMMAILLYIGAGWVRYASIALVVLFAMAWYNTTGTNTDSLGTSIAKVMSLIATALVFLPTSHRWFRWIFKTEIEEDRREETRRKAEIS